MHDAMCDFDLRFEGFGEDKNKIDQGGLEK